MNYWHEEVAIGPYLFPRFIGAPVDGVINTPYRRLIRHFSPRALLYTEIRHINAIIRVPIDQWKPLPEEQPINFQMTAETPQNIQPACERAMATGVTMVDINIGCPSRLVTRGGNGAGCALMGDLPRLKEVIKEFRRCLPTPLTVKMRAGYKEPNALEVVRILEDLGVNAICIHPRLQPQKHQGPLDYALVRTIKETVNIPVFFSGGITSWQIANDVYQQTGVDGFLIGRGLLGKPWLLQHLHEESQGRQFMPTQQTMHAALTDHLDYSIAWRGARGLAFFKKHLAEYLKGLGFSRMQRRDILITNNHEILKQQLQAIITKETSLL